MYLFNEHPIVIAIILALCAFDAVLMVVVIRMMKKELDRIGFKIFKRYEITKNGKIEKRWMFFYLPCFENLHLLD